ncbi:receptor-like protein EIX2, partial [Tanacetum coccineum]
DDERQALLQFKHGLIDEANQLASWVGKESDCCRWAGIGCDNSTGHVHRIHLPGSSSFDANTVKEYQEAFKKKLRGDLSPSILNLPQLRHLDLRYLNLSGSGFGGTIPPQLGNVTELRILCLEFLHAYRMNWSVRLFSKAIDWFQVINTLPSLVVLHLCNSQLLHTYPHVASLNLTSLSLLDLSRNNFRNSFVPSWIFSQTGLVSLDLTSCGFHDPVSTSINSFHNLTSLKFLHVSGNAFMSSSLVLEGLSMAGSNLISLDIGACGVSSSVLNTLHNLTSLLSLDLSDNQLTTTIPKSLGNLCNLRHLDLADTYFSNTSLTIIFESFFECKSPSLELLSLESSQLSCHLPHQLGQLTNLMVLQLGNNLIAGVIPESIGRLSLLRYLDLDENLISGPIPNSIGELSSLEVLDLSYNQLNGSLPDSLGQLSKTEVPKWIREQLNTTTAAFKLDSFFPAAVIVFKFLGVGASIFIVVATAERFRTFWRSFSNLQYLDMSQNQIHGELFHIPASLQVLDLSSNKFSGLLPQISNGSSAMILDLSNNSFVGLLDHLMCPCGLKSLQILNLADNHLSGLIPECWMKWPSLTVLNLQNNNSSGEIPKTLGSLYALGSLNMCGNKLSGRLPYVKNLKNLQILQLARNELDGSIPAWFGRELWSLRILNLQSNNFDGKITDELCYLTLIQILKLSHNKLSGNIPRCFSNFSVLSKKVTPAVDQFVTTLGLVMDLDLSSNNFSGSIPSELMTLQALQSLNLSRNLLTGRIPEKIGYLKLLESFDVSLNQLSGELPVSLSSLTFLSSFNVSFNNLTGRIPSSTQLQSFNMSSFIGNKLCGVPLSQRCGEVVSSRDQEEGNGSHGVDWDLIISILCGFAIGFWIAVAPLMVGRIRQIAPFRFVKVPVEFVDERWKQGTWDLNMFVKSGKMDWDALIVAEAKRRKFLELFPEGATNEEPVLFRTSIIPWWAWITHSHLPEAELLNGRAAMIGFFMGYLVDVLTGLDVVGQSGNFICKIGLFATVLGVILFRQTKSLKDPHGIYDR